MQKVILITGASSGIGEATAKLLAGKGHIVYGAARRVELLEELATWEVRPIAMDVPSKADRAAAVEQVIQEQGRIDVLINNAGFGRYGAVEDISLDSARAEMDVNLYGMVGMIQLVLPSMRKQNQGRIINVSSIAGKISMPMSGWYHASKHAIEAISDSLRMEVQQFGIEVVIIEPGLIDTPFYLTAIRETRENSGSGPYAEYAAEMEKFLANIITPGTSEHGSAPDVIAKVIAEAVAADKPKARYSGGKLAKLTLAGNAILSDRVMDAIAEKTTLKNK